MDKVNYWKSLQQSEATSYQIPPMPDSILTEKEKSKKAQEDWEKEKEYNKRYIVLKRNIETCVEARPMTSESVKDHQAIEYFTTIKGDVEKKIEKAKERNQLLITAEEQKRKLFLEEIDARIEKYKQQETNQLSDLQQKLSFIENRLQSAIGRTKATVKKSKEEIRCRKELEELIETVKRTLPTVSLEKVLPGYQTIIEEKQPYIPPSKEERGYISEKTVDPPALTPSLSLKKTVEETVNQTVKDETGKEFSTGEVEMPTPDGKPAVYQYGKRMPKNMSLEEAIARQNNPQLTFEPVETKPEPRTVPKIIKITKRKPAEENN